MNRLLLCLAASGFLCVAILQLLAADSRIQNAGRIDAGSSVQVTLYHGAMIDDTVFGDEAHTFRIPVLIRADGEFYQLDYSLHPELKKKASKLMAESRGDAREIRYTIKGRLKIRADSRKDLGLNVVVESIEKTAFEQDRRASESL